jgi:hypothetical protein
VDAERLTPAGLRQMREDPPDAVVIDLGRLWILWPKKASGVVSDLSQSEVRRAGLEAGLVDFKICAVDATWSGLCFTRRKGG